VSYQRNVPPLYLQGEYVSGGYVLDEGASGSGETPVVWTSLVNATDNGGGELEKTAGGNGWNTDGISTATMPGDCYVTWTAGPNNVHTRCGLSFNNTGPTYYDIDYCVYLQNTGAVKCYRNITFEYEYTETYTATDKLKVDRTGTTVTVWIDQGAGWVKIHTYADTESKTLLVDTCIYNSGAKLAAVNISGAG